jgi:hypothetical protein
MEIQNYTRTADTEVHTHTYQLTAAISAPSAATTAAATTTTFLVQPDACRGQFFYQKKKENRLRLVCPYTALGFRD